NRWYPLQLAAEAQLFRGDHLTSIRLCEESLALLPPNNPDWALSARVAAGVFAWTGAQDRAVDVLERLATTPVIGPAEIARDPIYTVPLAKNSRFQALVKRLEAKMQEIKL